MIPFNLQSAKSIDRQPRLLGKSTNEMASLELKGEPVTEVNLIVAAPADDAIVLVQNATLLSILLTTLLPDWAEADTWLKTALSKKQNSSRKVLTAGVERAIVLQRIQETGLVSLTVS